jgi:hypothetical protein
MPDEKPIKLGITEAITAGIWVASMAGLYFGLSAKLDSQALTLASLTERLVVMESQERAHERALIELTVTLRTKEIIK